jgi:WD40 repeat protein
VRLWNVYTGALQKTLSGHRHAVYSMVFSPDGRFLASASADGTVRIWDSHTGEIRRILDVRSRTEPSLHGWLLDISADRRTLYVLGTDERIRLWDLATGRLRVKSSVIEIRDNAAAFSRDKKTLAGRGDEGATFWDVPSGNWRGYLGSSALTVGFEDIKYSSDGQLLATASPDKTLRVWNIADRSVARAFLHPSEVNFVAFSPDNQMLISASGAIGMSNEVRIWKAKTGELTRKITGFKATCLALSPDGATLASGNHDNTITLWRIS